MTQFRVTLDALVAGNPSKAWKVKLPDGELRDDEFAPDREPPDDEWQTQEHRFDDLEAAKTFIRGLDPAASTHVVLEYEEGSSGEPVDVGAGWVQLYVRDADADHLEAADVGVAPPHLVTSPLPFVDDEIVEAPPVMARQEAGQ